ncbi:hypothetical protein ACA910_020647 [Epithemia clementina (nom. ined.)]
MAAVVDSDTIQSANWEGSIPVILTLSSSSLSSPTLPPPIHVLVSRHNYLHLALEDAVRKLHEFAPMTLFFSGGIVRNEPEPGEMCDKNDNDKVSEVKSNGANGDNSTSASPDRSFARKQQEPSPYPICWFEDEDTHTALRWHFFAGVLYDMKREKPIPWKIQLHFTSYPNHQILPLERDHHSSPLVEQIRHYYKNSLKQALCIQLGNPKAAMSLTKENHGRLWDAIQTGNYGLYRLVAHHDLAKYDTTRIPVRLLIDDRVPIQRPCRHHGPSSSSPAPSVSSLTSLGEYLAKEAPEWFDAQGRPKDASSTNWIIAGLKQPSLDIPMLHLWQDLRHPDRFLHIVISTYS